VRVHQSSQQTDTKEQTNKNLSQQTTEAVETRSTGAPVQSADRHTSTMKTENLGCAGVSKKYECTCPVCGQTHKYKKSI
jgi:D-aminopeptidase